MRKLKLQVQMTVDGYIAGPNGEMDWTLRTWDNDLKNYVGAITRPVDCIILGRKLAQGFIPYWASHPEEEGAEKFNQIGKVVFTKTLAVSEWENTILAKGKLVDEVEKLKEQDGGDIIVYGGATFVSALIKHQLIDEFHLFINPVSIGQGVPIFAELSKPQNLNLTKATAFECGIVVLNYTLKCD
ncbi:MAG: dihydrofolate reductase family protein [Deferribacteres bacterium]|nr:dihydrofolate reductase family protein [candidate division KSB1 bacterium]MCB9503602.1 dihydrofolate reductase family protein [Deferribacteres bacterium]